MWIVSYGFFFLLKNFEIQTNRKFVLAHTFFSIVLKDWKKKFKWEDVFQISITIPFISWDTSICLKYYVNI